MASSITSVSKREKVISLWSSGYRNKEICSRFHLSHQTVSNILSKFLQNGTAAPGKLGWKERTVATANVVEFVEYCKVAPWVDIVIGAFHALLEVSRHRSLFFRAKLCSGPLWYRLLCCLIVDTLFTLPESQFHYHYWIFIKWTSGGV